MAQASTTPSTQKTPRLKTLNRGVAHISKKKGPTIMLYYLAAAVDTTPRDTMTMGEVFIMTCLTFIVIISFFGMVYAIARLIEHLIYQQWRSFMTSACWLIISSVVSLISYGIALNKSDNNEPMVSTTEPTPPPTNTPPENNTSTEPMDWSIIINVLAVATVVILTLIIAAALYRGFTRNKIKKLEAIREAQQHERDNPTIRIADLRGIMDTHHYIYTDVMVTRAHELMITAPAFFDVTLPEAVLYEDTKRAAHDALNGCKDTTVASAEKIMLVDAVTAAWTLYSTKANTGST